MICNIRTNDTARAPYLLFQCAFLVKGSARTPTLLPCAFLARAQRGRSAYYCLPSALLLPSYPNINVLSIQYTTIPAIYPMKATHEMRFMYHTKVIFSRPITTTPAAEPMMSIEPPTPAQ